MQIQYNLVPITVNRQKNRVIKKSLGKYREMCHYPHILTTTLINRTWFDSRVFSQFLLPQSLPSSISSSLLENQENLLIVLKLYGFNQKCPGSKIPGFCLLEALVPQRLPCTWLEYGWCSLQVLDIACIEGLFHFLSFLLLLFVHFLSFSSIFTIKHNA